MIISERFTLIQHHLAKWAAVTVRFRYPEQTLASGRSASQVSGQHRLVGARITVSQEHGARPGQRKPDAERGHAR